MFNPYKLYRKSQDVQLTWIRNHPVQYVVLNASLVVLVYGYMVYEDRKFLRQVKREFYRSIPKN